MDPDVPFSVHIQDVLFHSSAPARIPTMQYIGSLDGVAASDRLFPFLFSKSTKFLKFTIFFFLILESVTKAVCGTFTSAFL